MNKDQDPDRVLISLSERDIEALAELVADRVAEKAAKKAVELIKDDFYRDVGKSTISKLFWLVGLVTVAVGVMLQQKGYLKWFN